ncbi:MAG: DNA gyrase subunit A, partial [Lacticaseibacillus paracasei]
EKEPVVLPARFPNLLVNGATGIAVGMTTNIPPHNLSETISALHVLMDNPDATTADLMQALPGPDFPTGGVVMGKSGIRHAYETGRGTIVLRGKVDVQTEKSGRERIVITEIPYMVNKAKMVERIADLVHEKKIDGIVTLRDESDRDGMRIVIDVRRDASASVILNNLYKLTPLQTGFSFNMVAIVNGAPKVLSLKQILQYYLDHQENVIRRRTQFDLRKAKAREHILEGLRIALDHIDEIITIIRSSETGDKAKVILMDKFKLSDKQSQAILDMRLVRLTGLEREKVESEYKDVEAAIADYTDILARPERVHQIIYNELLDIQKKFGDKRRTELLVGEVLSLEDEDLIEQEDVVITLSHNGYVKRLATSEFKAQNRGGRGIQGMNVHDDDFVERLISTSTHDVLLFFTNKGKVYRSKGYEIPEYGRTAKGIPIINLLGVGAGEKIQTVINVHEGENDDRYLFFVTQKGVVKRTPVKEFANIRSNGLIALNLKDEDELNNVILTSGQDNILIGTHLGYSVTFKEQDVRSMGRSATGVRGIRLREHDYVVGSDILKPDSEVFVISEKGYGKRTAAKEYPIKGRGGKGIKTANITAKNGPLAGVTTVDGTEDILVMTDSGVMIRFNIQSVSQTGRATLGVRLIRVDDDAKVATMAKVEPESDDPDDGSKPDQSTSPTDASDAPTSQQPADGSYAGDADQQVSQLLDRAEADQPEQHDTGDQPE